MRFVKLGKKHIEDFFLKSESGLNIQYFEEYMINFNM